MDKIREEFEKKYTVDFLKTCGYKLEFDEYWDNPMIQEEYQIFSRGYKSRDTEIDDYKAASKENADWFDALKVDFDKQQEEIKKLRDALEEIHGSAITALKEEL